MIATSYTVLLEGMHKTGKSSVLAELCKQSNHLHVVQDRGWASVHAFAELYNRRKVNTARAAHSFFANPDAVLVYFAPRSYKLVQELEALFAEDKARHSKWLGSRPAYANAALGEHLQSCVELARNLGYGERVLVINALSASPAELASQVLCFLNSLT